MSMSRTASTRSPYRSPEIRTRIKSSRFETNHRSRETSPHASEKKWKQKKEPENRAESSSRKANPFMKTNASDSETLTVQVEHLNSSPQT